MDLLNAVNRILPKLGEHTVTSLESKSPTLSILLPLIDEKIKELTIRGWWFNTHITTLLPDVDGNIAFPSSYLSFVADDYVTSNRGGKLHNATDNTFTWTAGVTGTAIEFIEFGELPETVASWVFYSALVECMVTDIGVTQEAQAWRAEIGPAQASVMSEHLRNMRYSTRNSRRYRRIRSAMCA